jgi:hypothetical protein
MEEAKQKRNQKRSQGLAQMMRASGARSRTDGFYVAGKPATHNGDDTAKPTATAPA